MIYGEKDPVNEPGIADRIHKLVPNSELYLIPEEGHFPNEGQPQKMAGLIMQWLSKLK